MVRSGDVLSRLGKMAELFDDHSPLQLQTSGIWTRAGAKTAFTLVGRLQYKYAQGTWTEWHAVLADGSTASLSEDNGAYVFSVSADRPEGVPDAATLQVGASLRIAGKPFSVASHQSVVMLAAQGELPHLPPVGASFFVVDLRSVGDVVSDGAPSGEVVTIDYGTTPATFSRGRAVLLEDLQLTGLKGESQREETGRHFTCPNCAAPVQVSLQTSKSITCASCNTVIDISQGIGGELHHALQDEPVQPLIPLGQQGQLQGVSWQVVGFQHRMGHAPDDPDEQFGWSEYLLFNRKRGFVFLVDSTEGWSVVKPVTGAPMMLESGRSATYLGQRYTLKEHYKAETVYVSGEFYWQVVRGQTSENRDFVSGTSLLSMEKTPAEVTWSVGSQISSESVAKAFKLDDKKNLFKRSDAAPLSSMNSAGIGTILIVILLLLVFLSLMRSCTRDCDPQKENCSSASGRTSGGSFGGYSGGGGHK